MARVAGDVRARGRRVVALGLALLGAAAVPTRAVAQSAFLVTPSLSVAEVYDDNLFSTPSRRERDFITRVSPGIEVGYESTPLTLLARYGFDAEVFAEHPELDSPLARQAAAVEARYLPDPLLTLGLTGAYTETKTPTELNVLTGVELARARTRRVSVAPSVAYRFDPLTTGAADYAFTRDEPSGGIVIETHTANLGLDHRMTARDTGGLGYSFRQFIFGGADTASSHALLLGWTHELTPLTTLALRAGPRWSEGSLDAEVAASVRQKLARGDLSITYARTQTTVVGQPGTVNTDSVGLTLSYQLIPSLHVSVAPGFFRSTRGAAEAEVYRVSLEATYRITSWLSLAAAYQWSLQRGALAPTTAVGGDEEIRHQIAVLKLTIAYPVRAD